MQSFEFFVRHILPGFSRMVDQHFWHRIIPQLSRSDQIIWDAVNAMSCLIRHPQYSKHWLLPGHKNSAATNANHRRALRWYSRSLSGLQQRISQGTILPGTLMVTCVLYTSIECLQDNLDQVLGLYQRAMAMTVTLQVTNCRRNSGAPRAGSLEHATGALLRHMAIAQGIPVAWGTLEDYHETPFESLSDAREAGYVLLAEAHRFIVQIGEIKLKARKDWMPSTDIVSRRKYLRTRMVQWQAAIKKLANNRLRPISESPDEDELYSALMLTYNQYLILLSGVMSMYETSLDSFFPNFQAMIKYARRVITAQRQQFPRPIFVFEVRVVPALYYVAIRCRHPVIRRQAIFLLERDAPCMEYYFKAEAMANVAKRVVGIEEAGGKELGMFLPECPAEKTGELPTEEQRIHQLHLTKLEDSTSSEPGHVLTYGIWRRQDEGGSWIPITNMIMP